MQESVELPENKEKETNENETEPLNCSWTLWCHENKSQNWKADGYRKICVINTVQDFWGVFNNLAMLGNVMQRSIFLFRRNIVPIWEDPENKKGGINSMRLQQQTNTTKYLETFANLSMLIVGEALIDRQEDMEDISGISFSCKNNDPYVKIWHKTKNSKFLDKIVSSKHMKKYQKCVFKYIQPKPQY